MDAIRHYVCFAITVDGNHIFICAGECGTWGCVIMVVDMLVCGECIRGTSVSRRVVVIRAVR